MSRRLTKAELDAQFEQFLKESVSDDSLDLGGPDKQPRAQSRQDPGREPGQNPTVSRWHDGESGGGEPPKRRFIKAKASQLEISNGSETSFRKSPSTSQPIQEEDEDPGHAGVKDEGWKAVNMSSVGLDTLEEEEEKARFFAQLEAEASTTIDYSKLNRELDSNTSTIHTDLRRAEEAAPGQRGEGRVPVSEVQEVSPVSPQYSEGFEDEENMEEPAEEKPKKSPILAGVSLYDSLDEAGGEDRKDTDRGQSYGRSGGSDMEALHEAYRQIQTVQRSGDPHFSDEGRTKNSGSSSPSPPPHHPLESLQPASTTESDLPTAEELMKTIRPDHHSRGFSLQPVSSLDVNQGETLRSLERTFPVKSGTDRDGKRSGKPGGKAAWGVGSGPGPPSRGLTRSVREEVDRLMQDHQTSSRTATGSRGSSVAPGRGRAAQKSSSSGPGRTTPAPRSPHRPPRATSTAAQPSLAFGSAESSVTVSGELVASVQSLVAVLQEHIQHRGPLQPGQEVRGRPEASPPQPRPQGAEEDLRVQLLQRDQQLQTMKEELVSLRQHNFLLHSKLRSAEEVGEQKKRWMEGADADMEEKLRRIDKEMKEQETLIRGYQQENERLYVQMKAQQSRAQADQDAMFTENQRLHNELAAAREQLKMTSDPVGSLTSAHPRLPELLAQISVLQRTEARLSEDNLRLRREKQSLEVDLQLIKKDRDLARNQVLSTSGDKSFEIRVLEDKHREEVLALKKKLQWFAENQDLLDRDAGRLKTATAEILQLKDQVEKLKQEVGRRGSEQQRKARDKSVDTKRMQDLERQVKELEQILRSRNPNSLPALIYAAATAGDDVPGTSSPISTLLERRIQRLEAELESRDEEAKRSLRTMEQQFHRIKLRYEQQISDLEQQLQQNQQVGPAPGSEPGQNQKVGPAAESEAGQNLEEELHGLRETHQKKEKCLQEQIQSLQQQLKNKAQPGPGRHQRQVEAALGARIERLTQELATKSRSLQELSRTVDRLQRERRTMLSRPPPRPEPRPAEPRPHPGQTRTQGPAAAAEETFPAAQCEKTYQPTVFTGSHILEVVQEKEQLQQRVEQLQQQREEEQQELRRLKQSFEDQLTSMEAEHRQVMGRLRAAHALQHSSSRAAELSRQLRSKEVAMQHLQEQLRELQGCREALRVSRSREEALQEQVSRLLQQLKASQEAQSSEVKLLCRLEKKMQELEERQRHREEELQQVMEAQLSRGSEQRWRKEAEQRCSELEAFRSELDALLDILRHLQQQGGASLLVP